MDRVATESGAQRASEAYWEVMVDDIKLGIMADSASWQNIQDQRPDLTLVSLREVALAYRHYSKTRIGTRWSRPRRTFLALRVSALERSQLMIRYPSDQDNAPSAADLTRTRGIIYPKTVPKSCTTTSYPNDINGLRDRAAKRLQNQGKSAKIPPPRPAADPAPRLG